MIAAIYARKSTDDSDRNEEARSTTRQVERATEYARAKGWTVDPRYVFVDDDVSGAEWKRRPGFNALLAALDPRPPFGVLVVSELSRIGRASARTLYAVTQIEDAGVEIHGYLKGRAISLEDEAGEVETMVDSLVASLERRRARQRTHDALRRRAEAGAVTGGRVFGYRNIRDGASYVHRAIDDAEAAIIRRVFTLYAEGVGMVRIAKRLNAEGVTPPRARGWAPSGVREMLRRPLYRGMIVWNRSAKDVRGGAKRQRRRDEREWITRDAPELAIVPAELAAMVDARLRAAAGAFPRARSGVLVGGAVQAPGYASPYLLTGFGRCAMCGGPLGTISRSHGSGSKRWLARFYGCTTRDRRGPATCSNSTLLRHEILDAAFLDAIRARLDDGLLRDAIARAAALRRARAGAVTARRPVAERELRGAEQRIARLVDAIAAGGPVAELLERLTTERARKAALVDELRGLHAGGDRQGADVTAQLTAAVANLRQHLGVHVQRTRQLLAAMLTGPVPMVPVVEAGARGYRFTGRLRLGGLLAGLGLDETRQPVVAPTGFEPVFQP
jgi:site-specific DNA recombinase